MTTCCQLYVSVPASASISNSSKALEGLLKCPVLRFKMVWKQPWQAFRVSVPRESFLCAVTSQQHGCHRVRMWQSDYKKHIYPSTNSYVLEETDVSSSSLSGTQKPPLGGVSEIKITGWNSRGIRNKHQVLQHLSSSGTDTLIVPEHWLWPYDLYCLNDMCRGFIGFGRSGKRLDEHLDRILHRGCGGIAIVEEGMLFLIWYFSSLGSRPTPRRTTSAQLNAHVSGKAWNRG